MSWEAKLSNPEATRSLGRVLAHALGGPATVHLRGDLGAGKSSLVRAWLRELGVEDDVRSPTYTLVESYEVASMPVHHLDLYRLGGPEELAAAGLMETLAEPGLIFIEWPEKGGPHLPLPDIEIELEYAGEGRRVTVLGRSPAGDELAARLGSLFDSTS